MAKRRIFLPEDCKEIGWKLVRKLYGSYVSAYSWYTIVVYGVGIVSTPFKKEGPLAVYNNLEEATRYTPYEGASSYRLFECRYAPAEGNWLWSINSAGKRVDVELRMPCEACADAVVLVQEVTENNVDRLLLREKERLQGKGVEA